MIRYRYLLVFVLILAGLLIGLFIIFQKKGDQSRLSVSESNNYALATASSTTTQVLEYDCQNGKSAFEVLTTQAQVESEDSSLGKLVKGINGISQNGGKYWLYSVDGKEATVGASSYICKGGEKIRWELK